MQKLNTSVEDDEHNAQHFQLILNKEIDRLQEICRKWAKIMTRVKVTEDGCCQINQAVGQTNLLLNKKFQTFHRLITECESGLGNMSVTFKDLQGFWDMMYIEVKDCDSRFKRLDNLYTNNWHVGHFTIEKPVPKSKTMFKEKNTETFVSKPIWCSKRRSLIAMNISRKVKSSEIWIEEALPCVNLYEAPKSILRTSKKLQSNKNRVPEAKHLAVRNESLNDTVSKNSNTVRFPLAEIQYTTPLQETAAVDNGIHSKKIAIKKRGRKPKSAQKNVENTPGSATVDTTLTDPYTNVLGMTNVSKKKTLKSKQREQVSTKVECESRATSPYKANSKDDIVPNDIHMDKEVQCIRILRNRTICCTVAAERSKWSRVRKEERTRNGGQSRPQEDGGKR